MNDHRGFQLLHESSDTGAISDVQLDVRKRRQRLDQSLLVPARIPLGAEKVGALIVVDTEDAPALSGKVRDDFGTDQTRGAGDEQGTSHDILRLQRLSEEH